VIENLLVPSNCADCGSKHVENREAKGLLAIHQEFHPPPG
jgi:hypothetical protein